MSEKMQPDIAICHDQLGWYVSKIVHLDSGYQLMYLGVDAVFHTAVATKRGAYFDSLREAVETLAKGDL